MIEAGAGGGLEGTGGRDGVGGSGGDQIDEKCSLNRVAIVEGSDTNLWLCLKDG